MAKCVAADPAAQTKGPYPARTVSYHVRLGMRATSQSHKFTATDRSLLPLTPQVKGEEGGRGEAEGRGGRGQQEEGGKQRRGGGRGKQRKEGRSRGREGGSGERGKQREGRGKQMTGG